MGVRAPLMLAAAGSLLAGSCTTTPVQQVQSPNAQRELADALGGRTAGPPANCVPNLHGQARMQVIDDGTILFRDGSTVYLQRPAGGCPGIESRGYTLVSRKVGQHQICRGDIQQLVDLQTGIQGGTCVFSEFIPYRKIR